MLALGLYVVLTLLLQAGFCACNKDPTNVSCNNEGDFKLLNSKDVNGYTDGVVLLCEIGTWRTIHDPSWTVADHTVACRQLGYMYSGAVANGLEFNSNEYQHSRKIMQCSGSESSLFECLVTNTTANTEHISAVQVNCTNRVLHSNSSTETSSTPLFSETTNIKPSSPVAKPSPSFNAEPVITTTLKAETTTSIFSSPALPPPTSSPRKATIFLTPFISGILGGLATLIGITVVIIAIFIITTRAKRRAEERKGRVDATNPHIYHELERVYDVIKESPNSDQRYAKDAAVKGPSNPEPYQKPVLGQSGEGFEPKAQYASLDTSKQYATLEAFTGDALPKTCTSFNRCTPPNATYSYLNHTAPAAHSEASSGEPDYSEIPVRPERTPTSNPVKDQETVHSQKGENEAPNDRKSAEYAILEPGFVKTQWKRDDFSSELATECLYYKHSLYPSGQPQEADRTSSELSTCNGHADLSTTHNE